VTAQMVAQPNRPLAVDVFEHSIHRANHRVLLVFFGIIFTISARLLTRLILTAMASRSRTENDIPVSSITKRNLCAA